MANDLLDLDDLAAYLGADPACTQGQLDASVASVRRYCRWHIGGVREDDELTIDGSGTTVLSLPTRHITAVTSIEVEGVELDDTAYHWSVNGTIERSTPWPTRPRSVAVTLDHGHPAADIPEVIGIVAQLAQRIPGAVTAGGQVVEEQISDGAGSYRIRLADGATAGVTLTALEQMILDSYRIGLEA